MRAGPRYPRLDKAASLLAVAAAYLAAVALGLEVASRTGITHPVTFILIADLAATLVVFAFSAWYRNASTYDPYWSVIPMLIVLYWWAAAADAPAVPVRQWLVVGLVWAWGARLTWNWLLRWRGLGDEDWRFGTLRARHGRRYWLVNLGGIHLLPTLLVFAGCLACWPALADSTRDLNALDALAVAVTASAIWLEARADRQLRQHRAHGSGVLHSGLWARCRHPNYLGEIGFWWGLYLFALAANPAWWWTGIGALGIHLLFLFVSVPMMDARLAERHPAQAERALSLPALLPFGLRQR
ncbi:MAG: DUF1295 domain-containing protein [Xanthomonadales bacterium]|nr:DUF1295 domain-containing protein [Xanthomonadales bacterium]